MGERLRILFVEDSLDDVELLVRELKRGGYDPLFERVETASAMKIELEKQSWDIVLADHSMPFFSGIGALTQLKLSGLDLPFIIVSGVVREYTAVEYINAGAYDYVMKDNLARLIPAIKRSLSMAEERLHRRQAEEVLRMNERKYRMLLENLPQRIFYKDRDSVYVSCNKNFADDMHIKPDEVAGKTDYDFYPKKLAEKYRADDKRIMQSGRMEDIDEKYVKDKQEFTIHTVKTPIRDENGDVIGILGIFWDITEKVALQKEKTALQIEAVRSRHLASLGELAAGVAHEINNPVTGIINCAQMLYNKSSKESKERDIASRIIKEGNRIAQIVGSLLSFARSGTEEVGKKSIINIGEILNETLVLTEAQLQKDNIKVKINIPQKLPLVFVQPHQIQQVFLNILSNARYALNERYTGVHENKILEISVEQVVMNNCPYVKITFHDYGIGISPGILDKVMDPFFTTKPKKVGTGLGLSISHSIIKENGGELMINSVEGKFTRVSVLLPVKSPAKTTGKSR